MTVKDTRHNVSSWNLSTRKVAGSFADGFTVDGRPMGFYHFSGFDSGSHRMMARKHGGDNAAITELFDWYERNIAGDGSAHATRWAYGAFSNGAAITRAHRIVYRRRHDLQNRFPDPFNSDTSPSYYGWFRRHGALEYPMLMDRPPHWLAISSLCRLAWSYGVSVVADPRHGREVLRRAWRVLRAEGYDGALRRLLLRVGYEPNRARADRLMILGVGQKAEPADHPNRHLSERLRLYTLGSPAARDGVFDDDVMVHRRDGTGVRPGQSTG